MVRVVRYLRFFVTLDPAAPESDLALGYMAALLRIAPVRLIDPERMGAPELPGKWGRFWRSFETPLEGEFINVVATRPARWTWEQRIDAATENDPDNPDVPTETIAGRLELYTAGVRNVLIAAPREPLDEHQLDTAAKYDAVITPIGSPALLTWVCAPVFVVHTPVTDHKKLRTHILGGP